MKRSKRKASAPKQRGGLRRTDVYLDSRLVSLRIPDKLWVDLDKFAKRENQNRNRLIVNTLADRIYRRVSGNISSS